MIHLFSFLRIRSIGATLIFGIMLIACGRQSDAAVCTGLESGGLGILQQIQITHIGSIPTY